MTSLRRPNHRVALCFAFSLLSVPTQNLLAANRFFDDDGGGGGGGTPGGAAWTTNNNWNANNAPDTFADRAIFDGNDFNPNTFDSTDWSNNTTVTTTNTGVIEVGQILIREADAPANPGESPHNLINILGGGTINLETNDNGAGGTAGGGNGQSDANPDGNAVGGCWEPRTAVDMQGSTLWSNADFGPTSAGAGYPPGSQPNAGNLAASGIYDNLWQQNINLMEDQRWHIPQVTLVQNTGVDNGDGAGGPPDGDFNDPGDVTPFVFTAEARIIVDGVMADGINALGTSPGTTGPAAHSGTTQTGQTLWKDGGGRLQFAGNAPNTFTGNIVVDNGELELNKNNGPAVLGDIIGMGGETIIMQSNQIADDAHIVLERGSDLRLETGVFEEIANFSSMSRGGERIQIGTAADVGMNDTPANGTGVITGGLSPNGTVATAGLTFGNDFHDGQWHDTTFQGELGGRGELVKKGQGIFTLGRSSNSYNPSSTTTVVVPGPPAMTTNTTTVTDSELLIHVREGVLQSNGNLGDGDWETVMEAGTTLVGTGRHHGEIFIKSGAHFQPGTIATGSNGTNVDIATNGDEFIHGIPMDQTPGVANFNELQGSGNAVINPFDNTERELQEMRVGTVRILSGGTLEMQIAQPTFNDGATAAPQSNIAATVPAIGGTALNNDYFGQNAGNNASFENNQPHDHLAFENNQDLHLEAGGIIDVNPFSGDGVTSLGFVPNKGDTYVLFDVNGHDRQNERIFQNDFSYAFQTGGGVNAIGNSAAPGFTNDGFNLRSGSQSALFDLKLPDISPGSIWNPTGRTLYWDLSLFISDGTLVIVPEPSRAALLALGLLGFCLRRRR